MADIIKDYYTLRDIAALKDPDGRAATVAELLTQTNTMLQDMPFKEGNMDAGERITMRTKIGAPKWKRYNEHIKPSFTHATQVDEVTAHLEDWSEVDKDLADKAGANLGNFLVTEAKPKMEAMTQEMAKQFIYGSLADDAKTFNGFMTRLNVLNDKYMDGQPVVIDAGGTNENGLASILLVGWGDSTVYGIYPKGSKAGLTFEDKGEETSVNEDGFLDVYRSKFTWDAGLAVKDYRYILRIANIDVEALRALTPETAPKSNLYMLFMRALGLIPNLQGVRFEAYAPREVWIALSQIAAATGNRPDSTPVQNAQFVTNIFGMPIAVQDAMMITEGVVKGE